MYLDHPQIMDPITHSYLMIYMDKVYSRYYFLVVTTLCSLEHLTDQILLLAYLDGLLHNRTIISRILLRVRILVRGLRCLTIQRGCLMG